MGLYLSWGKFSLWYHTPPLAGTLLLTYPPAGILLPLTGSHHTAWWLHSPLYPFRSPLYPLRSSCSSSVTPSRGIALPPWLPPTPWSNDVITGATVVYGYDVRPYSSGFLLMSHHYPLPKAHVLGLTESFFCSGEPAAGFGSLYLYFSMNCFLTCLGYIILGARRRGHFLWFRHV